MGGNSSGDGSGGTESESGKENRRTRRTINNKSTHTT